MPLPVAGGLAFFVFHFINFDKLTEPRLTLFHLLVGELP